MAFYNKDGRLNPSLGQALDSWHRFLGRLGILKKRFALVQFGDMDSRALNVEAWHKKLPIYDYYRRWIDIRNIMPPDKLLKSKRKMKKY